MASEEWALRHRAQERMGQMLMKAGPSYAGSYVLSPSSQFIALMLNSSLHGT